MIFASSSTVIGPKAFVGGAARTLGVPRERFQSVWEHVWFIPVKGFHAFEFGLLAWLLLRAGFRPLLASSSALAWAALDEYHQTFVPRRGGTASDVAIDAIGIAAAVVAWRVAARTRARRMPQDDLR